jgi:hypothetical protein
MTKLKRKNRVSGLTDIHRSFIVQQVACFLSPSETAAAVNEEFGLTVSRQAVERYDPAKRAGQRMAKRWKELFAFARQAFLDEVSDSVPLAHRSVRIKELAAAANLFKKQKNYIAMANMLERIAKEIGSVHTNRHEFTGKDGGPIRYQDTETMTDEQIIQELADLGVDASVIHPAPKTKQ